MKISALEQIIKSGEHEFPIYIGFIKAEELLNIAEVPNFKDNTPNVDISSNVLAPPIQQWQRPLIEINKNRITSTFDGTGEFMPNPVLVAERCIGESPNIKIKSMYSTGNELTDVKEITIPDTLPSENLPLWIIDGQHRINGLGHHKCKQKDNPVPVVFLLNNGGNFYNGRNLAKIFAQVTTEATPLAQLHKEWLTFAFELDLYKKGNPAYKSMETVSFLCKEAENSITKKSNGFHDDIKFNDMLSSKPKYLGHQYDCKDLSGIISKYYYGESPVTNHLAPKELANQISMAFGVLKSTVKTPKKSVFFGENKYCHKIMCDAYLVGIFSYLNEVNCSPSESDWKELLSGLYFDKTDWNFNQHVTNSNRWVDKSKKLAIDVFKEIFSRTELDSNVTNVWDYLSGDQLFVELELKWLNADEGIKNKDSIKYRLERGAKKTISTDGRKYFKISNKSTNAKHIEIFDEKSRPSDPIKFKPSGEKMIPPKIDPNESSQDPLSIAIKFTLYGGIEETISVTLSNWKS